MKVFSLSFRILQLSFIISFWGGDIDTPLRNNENILKETEGKSKFFQPYKYHIYSKLHIATER